MSDGRRLTAGKVIKPYLAKNGYDYVWLSNGKRSRPGVHQIVCEAFHGPRPTPLHEVNHLDGCKTCNTPFNLAWCTHSENQRYSADMGLKPHGEKSSRAKLTLIQVREIRGLLAAGRTQQSIAGNFSVGQATIGRIGSGQSWRNDQ